MPCHVSITRGLAQSTYSGKRKDLDLKSPSSNVLFHEHTQCNFVFSKHHQWLHVSACTRCHVHGILCQNGGIITVQKQTFKLHVMSQGMLVIKRSDLVSSIPPATVNLHVVHSVMKHVAPQLSATLHASFHGVLVV